MGSLINLNSEYEGTRAPRLRVVVVGIIVVTGVALLSLFLLFVWILSTLKNRELSFKNDTEPMDGQMDGRMDTSSSRDA